jgi:Domain of unknown function (DUF4340)
LSRSRRRGLVVVWGLLAALIVVIAALEYADRGDPSPDGPDPRALLGAPVEELSAIEIADRGRLHRFERDPAGSWFYHGVHGAGEAAHEHTPDPALAARIARAVEALGRARLERQFPLDRDGAAYGVAHPELVILAYRRGQTQPLAQYAVGHVAPDTVSRYVMVVGRPQVATIPKYQIDNLLELIQTASAAAGAAPAAERNP